MEDKIQIIGLHDFSESEKQDILKYSEKYYKKMERNLPGILRLHAKKYEKAGDRCKYSFHVKIQTPINLISVKEDDWDLHIALNKVMKKAESQIKHKFKLDHGGV